MVWTTYTYAGGLYDYVSYTGYFLLTKEKHINGVILPTIKIALLYQGLNGVARRIKIYLDSK